jgi:F-type H+-transporting ATPase subunit gamma
MTRRHEIDSRLHSLEDIGKIMRSMKNLAYMETRKLARFLDSQRLVVDGIEEAARDFLGHFPDLLHPAPPGDTLYLAIGAERGFCGSFNESVRDAIPRTGDGQATEAWPLVAVGDRLSVLLTDDAQLVARVPGAAAAEEVPAVLGRVVPVLTRIGEERGIRSIRVVHWDPETEGVRVEALLPAFDSAREIERPAYPNPPLLNLEPDRLLASLVEHHVFAALQAHLFGSLMAENRQRVRHLEGALSRVDDRVQELRQRRNLLRQEEITEEIELILLNLPDPAREGASRTPRTQTGPEQ